MRRISEGLGRSESRAIISASSCHCLPQPNKRTASAITTCSAGVMVDGRLLRLDGGGACGSRRASRARRWPARAGSRFAASRLRRAPAPASGAWFRRCAGVRRCARDGVRERVGVAGARALRRYRCGFARRGFGLRAQHVAAFGFVRGERNESLHGGEAHQRREETHDLDAFDEGAITFGLALRDDALEREDALARELDDPALRPFVFGPRLHVPVARVIERRISGVQIEAGLPAFEQRFELAGLFAGKDVVGHAPKSSAAMRGARVARSAVGDICARQHS